MYQTATVTSHEFQFAMQYKCSNCKTSKTLRKFVANTTKLQNYKTKKALCYLCTECAKYFKNYVEYSNWCTSNKFNLNIYWFGIEMYCKYLCLWDDFRNMESCKKLCILYFSSINVFTYAFHARRLLNISLSVFSCKH